MFCILPLELSAHSHKYVVYSRCAKVLFFIRIYGFACYSCVVSELERLQLAFDAYLAVFSDTLYSALNNRRSVRGVKDACQLMFCFGDFAIHLRPLEKKTGSKKYQN